MHLKMRQSNESAHELPAELKIKRSKISHQPLPTQCRFAPQKSSNGGNKRKQAPNRTGMPNQLKIGLENLSGYDLSSVRVHYNSKKPAQIGALAYTRGNQIHLGPGQNRHLPHEGWHAVQQMQGRVNPTKQKKQTQINDSPKLEHEADNMGAKAQRVNQNSKNSWCHEAMCKKETFNSSPVVQRAVGFEFQTNWTIHKTRRFGRDPVEYGKKTPFFSGEGWQMESDGVDIEYVVEHTPEIAGEAGINAVNDVMDNLVTFVGNLNGLRNTNAGDLRNNQLREEGINLLRSDFQILTNGQEIIAKPQATAGVRLDRISNLYQSLGTENSTAGNEFLGQAPGFYRLIVNSSRNAATTDDPAWEDHTPSAKLQGLLTMIAQYLTMGSGNGFLKTAKYMTFIMARTDFGAMFNNLDDEEKNHYSNDRNAWVIYVCDNVMNNIDRTQPVINKQINDGHNLPRGQMITIPITREDWLSNIAGGRDLLTKHANEVNWYSSKAHKRIYKDSRTNLGHRLRGFGELGARFDDLLNDQIGAIFEFRSMAVDIPYTDWQALARQTYQYFRAINLMNDEDELPVF